MKRFFTAILILFSVLLLAGCAVPAPTASTATPPPPEPIPVQVGVGFIPSVQFAPWYVAIEKGYFAEENLDVSLEYGFETDFLKLVGVNEREFIVASGEQVILGRAQGLPVSYVMTWYQKFPVVVFAPAESGILAPKDLIGKKVGIPGLFGASYIAWKALVYAADLPEDQIDLQSIGFTQAASLREGVVDAAIDYAANGPVQFQMAGEAVNIIYVDDYLKIPSNGLVTNETVIQEHPERVLGMTRALLRGIRDTLEDPDDAFAISLKYVPEAAQARETNRAIFDASLPFWAPPSGQTLGVTHPDIWVSTAAFLKDAGLVDTLVDTSGIWTNQFVQAADIR
ncbi:MAG: ABC transporter substrate-binding protein [Chloroflexi bacterium]|nr:ABC transporter substrate-binding protein [Chloroflexota bacterium]